MSIQEYKQRLHEVIDSADDEAALYELLETANRVLNSRDILDDLTAEQLAGLLEARKQVDAGNFITLDEFKNELKSDGWSEKIVISLPAEEDIRRISDFLEENLSPERAIRFVEAFYRKLDRIEEMPGLGTPSLKLQAVRKIRVDQYNMIYYEERELEIAILRVFDTRSNPDENPY